MTHQLQQAPDELAESVGVQVHEAPSLDAGTQAPGGMSLAIPAEPSLNAILYLAVQNNASVESLERLVALKERMEDRAAAQSFADQLADFQRECPPIRHNRKADFATRTGGKVAYTYAELDVIASTVRKLLHSRGFSYSWDQVVTGGTLKSICTLQHRNGHFKTASFECPTESNSAASPQQKYGAAGTYADRRSLIAVLGITTADTDTDSADPTPLSETQAADLETMATDANINTAKFLQHLGVGSFASIRLTDLNKAVALIEAKQRENLRKEEERQGLTQELDGRGM